MVAFHDMQVDPPREDTTTASTTAALGPTINSISSQSGITQDNTTTFTQYFDGMGNQAPLEHASATPTTQPTFNSITGLSSQGTVTCHNGVVDPPHQNTTISTTPTFGLTLNPIVWPPSSIEQGNATEFARSPSERIPMTSTVQPTFTSILGMSPGVMQTNTGMVSHGGGGPAYPRDIPFSLGSPPSGANTERTTPAPERVAGLHPPFAHTTNPPPGLSTPSRRLTITNGQDSPDDQPLSPTTPTSTGSGQQRRRPRPSHTTSQEIPQMLGEMRDVIGNLATSVNGLKDVVSDLRAEQRSGPSSTPVRGSGRGSRGQRRGRDGNIGERSGGGGGRNQNQSTSGPIGDDRTADADADASADVDADDESPGDEDPGERKDYKLRVSFIVHVRQLWD